MRNVYYFSRVKNVNNLRIVGWVSSVLLSPVYKICVQLQRYMYGKVGVVRVLIPKQYTRFSTQKNNILHLRIVTYTYYPQRLLLRPLQRI